MSCRVKISGKLVNRLIVFGVVRLTARYECRLVGPVAGGAIQQCEGALETASTGEISSVVTKVPLPRHGGVIARVLQQLRKGDDIVAQETLVRGQALLIVRSHLGIASHPGTVVIHTGQERTTRRPAIGRHVELSEHHALGREAVDVRGRHLATE